MATATQSNPTAPRIVIAEWRDLTPEEMDLIFGAGRKERRIPLGIETLERREFMAADLTASFANGLLRIEGTDSLDEIRLVHSSDRISIAGINIQTADGAFADLGRQSVQSISIESLAGNDQVWLGELGWLGTQGSLPALSIRLEQGVAGDTLHYRGESNAWTVGEDVKRVTESVNALGNEIRTTEDNAGNMARVTFQNARPEHTEHWNTTGGYRHLTENADGSSIRETFQDGRRVVREERSASGDLTRTAWDKAGGSLKQTYRQDKLAIEESWNSTGGYSRTTLNEDGSLSRETQQDGKPILTESWNTTGGMVRTARDAAGGSLTQTYQNGHLVLEETATAAGRTRKAFESDKLVTQEVWDTTGGMRRFDWNADSSRVEQTWQGGNRVFREERSADGTASRTIWNEKGAWERQTTKNGQPTLVERTDVDGTSLRTTYEQGKVVREESWSPNKVTRRVDMHADHSSTEQIWNDGFLVFKKVIGSTGRTKSVVEMGWDTSGTWQRKSTANGIITLLESGDDAGNSSRLTYKTGKVVREEHWDAQGNSRRFERNVDGSTLNQEWQGKTLVLKEVQDAKQGLVRTAWDGTGAWTRESLQNGQKVLVEGGEQNGNTWRATLVKGTVVREETWDTSGKSSRKDIVSDKTWTFWTWQGKTLVQKVESTRVKNAKLELVVREVTTAWNASGACSRRTVEKNELVLQESWDGKGNVSRITYPSKISNVSNNTRIEESWNASGGYSKTVFRLNHSGIKSWHDADKYARDITITRKYYQNGKLVYEDVNKNGKIVGSSLIERAKDAYEDAEDVLDSARQNDASVAAIDVRIDNVWDKYRTKLKSESTSAKQAITDARNKYNSDLKTARNRLDIGKQEVYDSVTGAIPIPSWLKVSYPDAGKAKSILKDTASYVGLGLTTFTLPWGELPGWAQDAINGLVADFNSKVSTLKATYDAVKPRLIAARDAVQPGLEILRDASLTALGRVRTEAVATAKDVYDKGVAKAVQVRDKAIKGAAAGAGKFEKAFTTVAAVKVDWKTPLAVIDFSKSKNLDFGKSIVIPNIKVPNLSTLGKLGTDNLAKLKNPLADAKQLANIDLSLGNLKTLASLDISATNLGKLAREGAPAVLSSLGNLGDWATEKYDTAGKYLGPRLDTVNQYATDKWEWFAGRWHDENPFIVGGLLGFRDPRALPESTTNGVPSVLQNQLGYSKEQADLINQLVLQDGGLNEQALQAFDRHFAAALVGELLGKSRPAGALSDADVSDILAAAFTIAKSAWLEEFGFNADGTPRTESGQAALQQGDVNDPSDYGSEVDVDEETGIVVVSFGPVGDNSDATGNDTNSTGESDPEGTGSASVEGGDGSTTASESDVGEGTGTEGQNDGGNADEIVGDGNTQTTADLYRDAISKAFDAQLTDSLEKRRESYAGDVKATANEVKVVVDTLNVLGKKMGEASLDELKDVFIDRGAKLIPGLNAAATAHGLAMDVIEAHRKDIHQRVIDNGDPTAEAMDTSYFTSDNPTPAEVALAGHTAFLSPDGKWFTVAAIDYHPKSGWIERWTFDGANPSQPLHEYDPNGVAVGEVKNDHLYQALGKAAFDKLVEKFPKLDLADKAREFFGNLLSSHGTDIANRVTSNGDPDAKRVNGSTVDAALRARDGQVAFKTPEGLWFYVDVPNDDPDYVPKSGWIERWIPNKDNPSAPKFETNPEGKAVGQVGNKNKMETIAEQLADELTDVAAKKLKGEGD